MSGLLQSLADPSGLAPRGACLGWGAGMMLPDTALNVVIGLSSCVIAAAVLAFVRRRRDIHFRRVLRLVGVSILACGVTRLLAVLAPCLPAYPVEMGLDALAALLSVVTAILAWTLLPRALTLPSRASLTALNRELMREMTEKDRTARQLRASEERMRAIYNSTPAPMHMLDGTGRLASVSDRWLDLLGYRREEVLGHRVEEFMDPHSAAALQADWADLSDGGELHDVERRMRCKSGEVRDVLVSARAERDEQGGMRVLCVMVDVTARKQAEAALRASREQLHQMQKLDAIGQLTGGIAHDFNNMLTVISGTLDLVRERLPPGDLRRLTDVADEAADRSARLTGQLLTFARRQHLDPRPLDPAAVVADMSDLLRRTLGERVQLHLPPRPAGQWRCLADRNQLETALLNLVLNARAAIGGIGTVTISVADAPVAASDPEAAEDRLTPGDYVRIAVADDGAGMSEEVRRRAFEPFFTTKPAGEGTGLGLAQIHGFIRQSGGTVRIHSMKGAGTRVEMLLPRALPGTDEASEAPARKAPPAAQPGECILVAEDEAGVRQVVVEALEALGYRVFAAGDAEEALTLLDRHQEIDLLFTDIVMPGTMDGVDLALEATKRRPGLPVVFTTGYSNRALVGRWAGEVGLLQKPYRMEALARQIRARLSARSASAGCSPA